MKKYLVLMSAVCLLTACQESLEQRAAREAREVTENKCPMPVGENLLLDSIVFDVPTLTQTQYFRFTNNVDDATLHQWLYGSEAEAGQPLNVSSARGWQLKDALVTELKNAPNYKLLMERGASFRYVYRAPKPPYKVLLDLTLTQEDYQ